MNFDQIRCKLGWWILLRYSKLDFIKWILIKLNVGKKCWILLRYSKLDFIKWILIKLIELENHLIALFDFFEIPKQKFFNSNMIELQNLLNSEIL